MGKNNKTAPKKEQKKPEAKAPKIPESPKKAAEKVEEAKVITKEELVTRVATMTPDKFTKSQRTLSPDAKVMALNLIHKTMVEPQNPALAFPEDVQRNANQIVAIGSLCALADHSANGDDSFALIMQKTGYKSIIEAAESLGYKMPDIKALPVLEDGRVKLEAKNVEIPDEEKEKLKKEAEVRATTPELDPEKITSEEDLKKALEFKILDKKYRLVDIITDGIDFMRKFRLHEASLAENAEQAKKKFESYNSGDWLDDMFSYIKPSVFFNGIGRGMASVTEIEKNPIHAFTIFRDAIKSKDTNLPALDDQEIAFCVKSIIKWICNNNIESNKKAIENLDAKKNSKEIAVCKASIEKYENILSYITNPSSEEVDNLLKNIGSTFDDGGSLTTECQKANTTFNRVCKTFYDKNLSTTDYKNLDTNVQQYAGYILNLFLDAGSQLKSYNLANISELEARTEEEKEELLKKLKKEWADRKKAEKSEESKNA